MKNRLYIYRYVINEIANVYLECMKNGLTIQERKELLNIKNKNKYIQKKSVYKYIVSKHLDVNDVVLKKNIYGEYNIKNVNNKYFSFSSCDNLIVVAVLEGNRVGVDVEYLNKNINIIEYIEGMNRVEKDQIKKMSYFSFFEMWTKKESLQKYLGLGMYLNPKDIYLPNSYFNKKITFKSFRYKNYLYSICYKPEEVELVNEQVRLLDLLRKKEERFK